ncbi:MAG: ADP-ribosylation factor-like protein [Candidatus Hodarchaeales archaeon]
MSEWISEAEISSRLGHKILIAGLSEAGKTAVKRIFFLKQTTEDVSQLSATLNYERLSVTIKDTPITIVDLGGQKIFLKRFLSTFSPFVFSNVKIFIFLIDVANKTTRNNALQYFTACIEKLKTFSPEAEVFMFLHKNDLIRSSPNYDTIHELLKESFQLEYDAPLRFFRTTIYKPETVIDAFGRIFELAIPSIKESEFVESRAIGDIEEYHTKTMTLRKAKVKIKTSNKVKIQITSPKMAGDPKVLSKLQSLMQKATVSPSANSTTPISKEPLLETFLEPITQTTQPVKEKPMVKFPSVGRTIPATESEPVIDSTPKVTEISRAQKEPETLEGIADTEVIPDADDVVEQILYLVEFCRIEPEDATEVVKSGYGELFKLAASSGIPVSFLREIFLKYLPFVHTSEGNEKFQLLTGQRLLEIFSAHLKNKLEEESFIKCLVFAIEKPDKSIDEIISKYLIPKEKKKKKEKKKEKKAVTKPKISIPDAIVSTDGIITLPGTQGISFKVELLENGLNAKISFYLEGATGLAENIGNQRVSANINSEEILYLLAYEMNMFNMGYFEDGAASMAFSAKLIYGTIRKMKKQQLTSTLEIPSQEIKPDKLSKMIDYIIPLEIKTNGEFLLLPDTEKLAFSVEKSSKKGVLISFVQRGYPIGQVNVIESINQNQLSGLLKQAMQLPIESDSAVDFAARMIKVVISELIRTKATKLPRKITPEVKAKKQVIRIEDEEEEETSEKLQDLLSLLETD